MFIYKVILYLMLAIQRYRISVLCNPLVSPSYVKQAASNQASANERFRPTSSYDSTPTEYVNDNEKFDFTRMKIIHKIKSSVAISVPEDPTLIEKKAMEIKRWPNYNSMVRENTHSNGNHTTRQASNLDQHEKFVTNLRGFGICREKWQSKRPSVETSRFIAKNNAGTSYQPRLKKTTHYHILKDEKQKKVKNSKLKRIFSSLPASDLIGLFPVTVSIVSNSLATDKLCTESTMHHRVRRQLQYIPTTTNVWNYKKLQRMPTPESGDLINSKRLPNPDPGFIHSLLGVFDQTHPLLAPNVHPIKPNEVIITPPRYIDQAKILPHGLRPTSTLNTRPEDTQFVKNTERNPSGFGESERVFTTGMMGKKKPSLIIQDHFLPTVRPYTIPKKPSHRVHHYVNTRVEEYPENHQIPSKSIVSATKNLYHETPDLPESYKHHGKDTKYDRYGGKYAFEYHVADIYSANDFGHQETRNEHLTEGKYHVRLPDGRVQKVSYHVDEEGYHANVSYEPNDKYYYV